MNISNGIGSAMNVSSEINPVSSTAASRNAAVSADSQAPAAAQRTSATQDQASISSTSGLLSTALNGTDVRTDKVASVKASIDAGTYDVSSSKVADSVISSLLR